MFVEPHGMTKTGFSQAQIAAINAQPQVLAYLSGMAPVYSTLSTDPNLFAQPITSPAWKGLRNYLAATHLGSGGGNG